MLCTMVAVGGCNMADDLRSERMALTTKLDDAIAKTKELESEFIEAQKQDDVEAAGKIAAKLDVLSEWMEEARPLVAKLDEKVANAEDGEEFAIGVVEIAGSLLGIGGLTGVLTDRWRRNRERRIAQAERDDISNTFRSGFTMADEQTLARLPRDVAKAILVNGRAGKPGDHADTRT